MNVVFDFFKRYDLRKLPIAIKISLGMLVGFIVSGVIITVLIQQSVRSSQVEIALEDLKAFGDNQALRVVDTIGQEVITLSRFSELVNVPVGTIVNAAVSTGTDTTAETSADLQAQVTTFHETHNEYDSIAVISLDKHILAIDPAPAKSEDQAQWGWFDAAFNNGHGMAYLGNPGNDGLTYQKGIQIAIPIYSEANTGKVIGILYANWNMSDTTSILSGGDLHESIIVQDDGTILLSPSQLPGSSLETRLTEAIHANATPFSYQAQDGQEWLVSPTHLTAASAGTQATFALNWLVITRQPFTIIEPHISFLTTRILLVTLLGALLVALLILFLSRTLFSPLIQLTVAASQISAGHLNTAIPQFPLDEIGQLAQVLDGVVKKLLSRVGQLQTTVRMNRSSALTTNPTQLLTDIAQALVNNFNYPEVRIYIADLTSRRAQVQAAAGGESERLLRAGHRIDIDETTLVGRSMLLNEALIGGGREALREAGLITEHSEVAIPLSLGTQMMGAIHVIAGRLREIETEDIDILRLIAEQVSVSLQNARLFQQSSRQIAEIEALNRRLTRSAWEEYVGESGTLRHTLDPQEQWPEVSDGFKLSTEIKASTSIDPEGRSVLAAPLILRGEAVGTLAVTRPGNEDWSRDEVMLLEAIANRMAIIAEGIRLVDEAALRAEREHQVNEVSANLLQRATNVETVLRSALSELGGALGSERISLRIGPAPARDDRRIESGDAEQPTNGNEPPETAGPQPEETTSIQGDNGGGVNNEQ
jgi:GAF domain-containing protein